MLRQSLISFCFFAPKPVLTIIPNSWAPPWLKDKSEKDNEQEKELLKLKADFAEMKLNQEKFKGFTKNLEIKLNGLVEIMEGMDIELLQELLKKQVDN